MLNKNDFILFSMDSYIGNENINNMDYYGDLSNKNFTLEEIRKNNKTGFQGKVYKNEETKEIVIAYAGTNKTSLVDYFNDLQMILGYEPLQLNDAYQLYRDVSENFNKDGEYSVYLTGHSLGGMLATLVRFEAIYEKAGHNDITCEEYYQIKDKIPAVYGIETPSISLMGDYDFEGSLWSKHKYLLREAGYEKIETKYGNISPIVYSPTETSIPLDDFGIHLLESSSSDTSMGYGIPIGIIDLINDPNSLENFYDDFPVYSNYVRPHGIDHIYELYNNDSTEIYENYQNLIKIAFLIIYTKRMKCFKNGMKNIQN